MPLNTKKISSIKIRDPEPPKTAEASFKFVCISIALMAAVNVRIFGTKWAAFIVALSVAILYLGRIGMFSRLMRQPILILLPCLFVLSCAWSDEPKISLSLGLQTLLTALAGVTIGSCTSRRQFLMSVFAATSVINLASLASGRLGPAVDGMVLIGFLGSKDAMGLFAYGGVMASVAMMFDREQKFFIRACALLMTLIEIRIATSVHAATALIALALGLTSFFSIYFFLARSKAARWVSYFFITFIVLVVIAAGSEILDLFLHTAHSQFGKDSTLTGRTILWAKAISLFLDSPILGHGFRAYWVGSSPDAQRLLQTLGIPDGRGFNFHQQYLEVLADTGFIGEIILLTTFTVFARKMWKNAVTIPSYFTAYSFSVLFVYYIRWLFETAFVPFSFDMMIIYGLAAAAMKESASNNDNKSPRNPTKNIHPALLRKKAA